MCGWELLYGFGFGFLDDISAEVLVQDRFITSIRCHLLPPFSEFHIWEAVQRIGQSIVYEVLLSHYAVPKNYAGRGFVIQLLMFLFRNVDEI
jgi:hypothetical protein